MKTIYDVTAEAKKKMFNELLELVSKFNAQECFETFNKANERLKEEIECCTNENALPKLIEQVRKNCEFGLNLLSAPLVALEKEQERQCKDEPSFDLLKSRIQTITFDEEETAE